MDELTAHPSVRISDSALVADALSRLRAEETSTPDFRAWAHVIGLVLVAQATADLALTDTSVHTPLGSAPSARLERRVLLVPVLRAGLVFLDAALAVLPGAEVGFIGLSRDEQTLAPSSYLSSLPDRLEGIDVVLLEPMIATGGSSACALDLLADRGAHAVRVISLLATPAGLDRVLKAHPSALVHVAAVDQELSDVGFIVPGLGDAGDRAFGPA